MMLMTTGSSFENYRVEKYLGLVTTEMIIRSGIGSALGAALSNFVSGLTLKDYELTGSTELIARAKGYLFERFEKDARSKGANAVLGIDIETSFGTELARVSINGTAVLVKPVNENTGSDSEGNTDSSSVDSGAIVISVQAANTTDSYVPVSLELSSTEPGTNVSLTLLKTGTNAVGDLIADVEFINKFSDKVTIENIYFLSFKESGCNKYRSDFYPVRLPVHIVKCLQACNVFIRKRFLNDELVNVDSQDLIMVESAVHDLPSSLNKDSLLAKIDGCTSMKEISEIWNELSLDEAYPEIKEFIVMKTSIERSYGKGDFKINQAKLKSMIAEAK